jgi:chromosome segregation ATPase
MFQNIGPSPSKTTSHAMASDGTRVFVLGGHLSSAEGDEIHVLDTSTYFLFVISFVEFENAEHIKYPAQAERDQRLTQLTDELREHTDRLLEQTSLVEQKDAELVDLRAKLDDLLLSRRSRDQHVHALEKALQKATSRAAEADERSQRACERYETELVGVRAELRVRKSELKAVRLRLTDAENGWAKSKREADTSRARTTAGLASTNEDRITRGRIDAEMASLWSNDKNSAVMQFRNEG